MQLASRETTLGSSFVAQMTRILVLHHREALPGLSTSVRVKIGVKFVHFFVTVEEQPAFTISGRDLRHVGKQQKKLMKHVPLMMAYLDMAKFSGGFDRMTEWNLRMSD
jgi:hypothetical protein